MSTLTYDRLCSLLVAFGGFAVLLAPAGWLWGNELDHLHAGGPQWHVHDNVQLLWQGISYIGLGLVSIYAAMHPRTSMFRWVGTGIPLVIFTGYILTMWWLAPSTCIDHSVTNHPQVLGIRSNVLWAGLVLASVASGLALDRHRGMTTPPSPAKPGFPWATR